jgi:hypothetical protein
MCVWTSCGAQVAVSDRALIMLAALEASSAHDEMSPQRIRDSSRAGSFGFWRITGIPGKFLPTEANTIPMTDDAGRVNEVSAHHVARADRSGEAVVESRRHPAQRHLSGLFPSERPSCVCLCVLGGNSCYPPANFFLATGRAKAFVGPCPLFSITLP